MRARARVRAELGGGGAGGELSSYERETPSLLRQRIKWLQFLLFYRAHNGARAKRASLYPSFSTPLSLGVSVSAPRVCARMYTYARAHTHGDAQLALSSSSPPPFGAPWNCCRKRMLGLPRGAWEKPAVGKSGWPLPRSASRSPRLARTRRATLTRARCVRASVSRTCTPINASVYIKGYLSRLRTTARGAVCCPARLYT